MNPRSLQLTQGLIQEFATAFKAPICVVRKVRYPIIEVGAQCRLRRSQKPHEWYLLKLLVLEGAMSPEKLAQASGIPAHAVNRFLKDTVSRGILIENRETFEITAEGLHRLEQNTDAQRSLVEWMFLFDGCQGTLCTTDVYDASLYSWHRSDWGIPIPGNEKPSALTLNTFLSLDEETRKLHRFSSRILQVESLSDIHRSLALELYLVGDAAGTWKLFHKQSRDEFSVGPKHPQTLLDLEFLKPTPQQLQALRVELSELGISQAKLLTRKNNCPAVAINNELPKQLASLLGSSIWLETSGLVVEITNA